MHCLPAGSLRSLWRKAKDSADRETSLLAMRTAPEHEGVSATLIFLRPSGAFQPHLPNLIT